MKDMDTAEVAKATGVPASTLRYYEEKGLIASAGRTFRGRPGPRPVPVLRDFFPDPLGRPGPRLFVEPSGLPGPRRPGTTGLGLGLRTTCGGATLS